jgi:heme/copper-type cytochrome/quinol oxidase subunit 1
MKPYRMNLNRNESMNGCPIGSPAPQSISYLRPFGIVSHPISRLRSAIFFGHLGMAYAMFSIGLSPAKVEPHRMYLASLDVRLVSMFFPARALYLV